jgi:histidyl-tRNA synthetase
LNYRPNIWVPRMPYVEGDDTTICRNSLGGLTTRPSALPWFLVGLGEKAERKVFGWVRDLRKAGIWVEMEYASKGLKAQMKKADRLGAKKVLMVGENELVSGKGILRDMKTKEQTEVDLKDIVNRLRKGL